MSRGRGERLPVSRRDVVFATVFAVATIVLTWLIAVPWGPVACPAIMPPPTNCISTYREGTALVVTVAVVLIYAATMALAFTVGRRRGAVAVAGVTILGIALVGAWPLVALLPGFPIAPG